MTDPGQNMEIQELKMTALLMNYLTKVTQVVTKDTAQEIMFIFDQLFEISIPRSTLIPQFDLKIPLKKYIGASESELDKMMVAVCEAAKDEI